MKKTKMLLASLTLVTILSSCSDSNTAPADSGTTELSKAEATKVKMPTELIAGKWGVDNITAKGEEPLDEEALKELRSTSWMQFSPDGKISSKMAGEDFIKGTWTMSEDGKSITVKSNQEGEEELVDLVVEKLDETNLIITLKDESGDMKWICKK